MIQVLPTVAHMGETRIMRFWNSETYEWVDLIVNGTVVVSKSTDDVIVNRNLADSAAVIQQFIN
jgi:hypothetical protein